MTTAAGDSCGSTTSCTATAEDNHDYHTAAAAGDFAYFGAQAPAAYHSYDLGSWHLISIAAMAGVPVGGRLRRGATAQG